LSYRVYLRGLVAEYVEMQSPTEQLRHYVRAMRFRFGEWTACPVTPWIRVVLHRQEDNVFFFAPNVQGPHHPQRLADDANIHRSERFGRAVRYKTLDSLRGLVLA
jgi:hypothetical protein